MRLQIHNGKKIRLMSSAESILSRSSQFRVTTILLAFVLSLIDGVPGRPGKSQKKGQQDQGGVKELGGTHRAH